MIDSQLILVDGIPGSGKSTTAQWIALQLRQRQLAADWFMDEHRGNPVTAFENLSVELFITRMVEKWDQFSQSLQTSNSVMVLEGCFFQHILERLFTQDVERTQIHTCIQAVADTIRPLNPVLIYFYQTDIALALQTIHAERGSEWSQRMLEAHDRSPYAQARHTSGLDALVKYYEEYRAFTDPLGALLGLRTLLIENSARDWARYQTQILQYLALPPATNEPIDLEYLARFAGHYRDRSGSHPRNPECRIELEQGRLVIYDFRYPRSPLIPKAKQEFYVETLGYELSFDVDEQSRVSQMKVGGQEPGVGIGSATLLGREYQRIQDD
jgi:hypothetical protein